MVERPHKGESHAAIPPLVRAESASSLRQSTNNNAAHQQTSKNDLNQLTSDDLSHHIVEFTPKEGSQDVPLGTNITVLFDKDVRTVNINKLFEVSSQKLSPNVIIVKRLHVTHPTHCQILLKDMSAMMLDR